MASTPPKKGAAYTFGVYLYSQAQANTFQLNPTLVNGDVMVSVDGGAFANISMLPVVTPAGSKRVQVTVSDDEMNGDSISVLFSDASGNEWKDLAVEIETSTVQMTDVATDADLTNLQAALSAGVVTVVNPVTSGGDLHIRQDNDYYIADGNAPAWTYTGPADLTGAALKLHVGGLALDVTATPSSGNWLLQVEIPKTSSSELLVGTLPYEIEVDLANSHHIADLIVGSAIVESTLD